MNIGSILQRVATLFSDLPPLILRLIVAHGFYEPALVKLKNIGAFTEFLTKLQVPAPQINAYLSVATESLGVMCMILGLATRLISIPMMVMMVVAVSTVHWKNGFSCGHNGYQVPLYFFLLLVCLLIQGPGRFSVDDLIRSLFKRKS